MSILDPLESKSSDAKKKFLFQYLLLDSPVERNVYIHSKKKTKKTGLIVPYVFWV